MTKPVVTYKGVVKADGFEGAVAGEVSADDVTVAAYVAGGIAAGDLQEVLEALADRIDAVEQNGDG